MLLIYLLVKLLVLIPFWILCPRYGMPSWAALAALLPFGAVALLWIMALTEYRGGVR